MSRASSFKQYKYGEAAYAPRHTKEEWESHRHLLTTLHVQGVSRREMCNILAEHGFKVKSGQLVRKMTEWNLMARDRDGPEVQANDVAQIVHVMPADNICDETAVQDALQSNVVSEQDFVDLVALRPEEPQKDVGDGSRSFSEDQVEECRMIEDASNRDHTEPFHVVPNLWDPKNRARMLQMLEAAELGFPRTKCCCHEFFKGQENSKLWASLYQLLLKDGEMRPCILKAKGLVYLCRYSTPDESTILQLRTTFEHYSKLLARVGLYNVVAYAIGMQLAQEVDCLDERDGTRAEGVIPCTKTLILKYQDVYRQIRDLPSLILDHSDKPEDCVMVDDGRRFPAALLIERLDMKAFLSQVMRDCQTLLQKDKFEAVMTEVRAIHGWSYSQWQCGGHEYVLLERIDYTHTLRLAERISVILSPFVLQQAGSPLQDDSAHMITFINAISLLVAKDFHSSYRCWPSRISHADVHDSLMNAITCLDSLRGSLDLSEGPAINTLCRQLQQACWICDPDQRLIGPQGLHLDNCRAQNSWRLWEGDVTHFDPPRVTGMAPDVTQETGYVRRRNTQGRVSDLPDDASMRTSSTMSSFREFKSLAFRFRNRNSAATIVSIDSKWSGHMSVESWRLEKIIDVGEDNLESTLTKAEHQALDKAPVTSA